MATMRAQQHLLCAVITTEVSMARKTPWSSASKPGAGYEALVEFQ